MELFADVEPLQATGTAGGAITLIAGLWWIVQKILQWRSDNRITVNKANDDADKVKRVDTIAELRNLLDILRADFDAYKRESKAELKATKDQLEASEARSHECDRRSGQMEIHIFNLEDAMRRAKITDFRSWSDIGAGSGNHVALKETKP